MGRRHAGGGAVKLERQRVADFDADPRFARRVRLVDRRDLHTQQLFAQGRRAVGTLGVHRLEAAGRPSAASAATAKAGPRSFSWPTTRRDPHGHDDHLADGFAAQNQIYRIERQNGSLNFRISGAPWHGNITPFLAVDLDHQRHGVFNQQIAFDLRPIDLQNQPRLAKHLPALLGQMRHHGREQSQQDGRGLLNRPGEVGAALPSRPSTSASALANSLIWARQTFGKCSRSMPDETLSSAPWAALRKVSASVPNDAGRTAGAAFAMLDESRSRPP